MENRRECYRHPFPPEQALPVIVEDFAHGAAWQGQALDLSLTGMRIRIADPQPQPFSGRRANVRLFLDPAEALSLPIRVVHAEPRDPGVFGCEFVESIDPRTNERREKKLWAYLLQQQRRERQRLKSHSQAG